MFKTIFVLVTSLLSLSAPALAPQNPFDRNLIYNDLPVGARLFFQHRKQSEIEWLKKSLQDWQFLLVYMPCDEYVKGVIQQLRDKIKNLENVPKFQLESH